VEQLNSLKGLVYMLTIITHLVSSHHMLWCGPSENVFDQSICRTKEQKE